MALSQIEAGAAVALVVKGMSPHVAIGQLHAQAMTRFRDTPRPELPPLTHLLRVAAGTELRVHCLFGVELDQRVGEEHPIRKLVRLVLHHSLLDKPHQVGQPPFEPWQVVRIGVELAQDCNLRDANVLVTYSLCVLQGKPQAFSQVFLPEP